MREFEDVPVFILCGGLGTRLKEDTEFRPKPMAPIGSHPMLWHIMRSYRHHGFRRFVLCLGFKAEVIKSYFLNFTSLNSDVTVDLASNAVTTHSIDHDLDWEVTLAFTGQSAMTGARIARAAARYLGAAPHFAVTYGDGLTDADLADEFRFHCAHGKVGTVLGVNPPSRFGELIVEDQAVRAFVERADIGDHWINGGYFFFSREFLRYLSDDETCVLERDPLSALARDGGLGVYRHNGFWACMDTQRDREYLNALWQAGHAPWRR